MHTWLNIFYNLLWILGLAIILAAFSYAEWQANQQKLKLRDHLKENSFQLPLSTGLFLISVSLLLLAQPWWERLLWLIFAMLFTHHLYNLIRTIPQAKTILESKSSQPTITTDEK